MKRYFLLLCLIIAASTAVPQITAANFLQELAANELVFIKYFSPNCGHCIAMAPEFEQFAQQSKGKNYKVFEVDCSQEQEVCKQSGVRRYPTLQLYVSGTSIDYEGERTAQAISAWLEGLVHATLPVLNTEQVQSKMGKETFVIISGMTQKVKRAIAIITKAHDYGINYYSFQANGYIRLYKEGTTEHLTYRTDHLFPKSLLEFALLEGRPPVLNLQKNTFKALQEQKTIDYVLGIVDQGDQFSSDSSTTLSNWCGSEFKNIACVRVDPKNPVYEELKRLSKTTGQRTNVFIAKRDFSVGYHFPHQTVTAENLSQFFEEAKADKIYRAIDAKRDISERVKYTNVIKLTPENYKKTIAENQVVFIEYYSPTCGHCVKFAPDFESVGAHFKNINSNVVVAALDLSDEQDGIMKQEDIPGFPHFRLFIRGNKILYRLARSAESMIKFITDLSTAKFEQAASLEEISARAFVVVSGIAEDSYLNALAGLFTVYPIYRVPSEGEFAVSIHTTVVKKYTGKADIWELADWLEIQTSPVLVSLGEPNPNKKLEKALINHTPIVLVVNKHERSAVEQTLNLLTQFCEDKTAYVCGYLHKGDEDYQSLLEWLSDTADSQTNRLFWINTQKSLKYNYEGDLDKLTAGQLEEFIRAVQAGEVPAFGAKQKKSEAAQQANEEL